MSVYQPQEQHGEPDHPERVEDESDAGAAREAERMEEQPEEPEHPAHFEHERDTAAAHERDHPEHFEDERDGAAAQDAERRTATAAATPRGAADGPASMPDERGTVLEDRESGRSHAPALTPTSTRREFQVFDPGELDGYRSRWESL